MRRAALIIAVTALVVVSGCAAPAVGPAGAGDADGSTTETTAVETTTDSTADGETTTERTTDADPGPSSAPADPPTDRLGWENGYWYNESPPVTPEDGYNESERRAVLARTMARVEVIRQLEFTRNVTVTVISREEYRENNVFEQDPDPFQDQVYEATFLVGEDTHASEAFNEVYGGSVGGYYYSDQIVLVSEDTETVDLDRATLAHELVHAIQDQHRLYVGRRGATTDRTNALTAVSEGEANYVMDRYEERCGTEWRCIPPVEPGSSDRSYNAGLHLTLFAPYSEGPEFMRTLDERGGWGAVEGAYDDPPESTEQVIHPEKYPDDEPVDVTVEDRSGSSWSRMGEDTVGEAVLYATFWYNGVIDEDHLFTDERRYNYSNPATEGWGGDRLVAYESDDGYGYVFATVWDTEADAEQFHEAYVELLESNGATERGDGVYRVPEGEPFADAYRVERDGKRVVITNAPTVEDLDDVRDG